MAGIYDLTLASGLADNLSVLGDYVKVVAAPAGAVRVKLDGGEALQLLEGQGLRLTEGKTFRDVMVQNVASASQTVLLFIGDKRFEDTRITGSVRVIDEITEAITLATGGLPLVVAAWTATQLVAPAANVRGCIVRRAYLDITSNAGGYCDARITASKTAPTSSSLPAQQFQFVTAASSAGATVQKDSGLINKLIPPGFGIYAPNVVQTAAAANMAYLLQYELL